MKFVVTPTQMNNAELCSEKLGVTRPMLMKNAARACVDALQKRLGALTEHSFAVICGRGNNGGDGLEIVSLLIQDGAQAVAILADDLPNTETARECFSRHEKKIPLAMYLHRENAAKAVIAAADVIIDCVFGTGFHGEPDRVMSELFRFINNECDGLKVSVDVPSGVNALTGEIAENAIMPTLTLTLGSMKTGMLCHPCYEFCGEILLLDIGITDECYTEYEALFTPPEIAQYQPQRRKNSNKGTFGRVLNIAGSGHYNGAALLSTRAALRSGAGLVTLATPKRVVNCIASAVPEAVFLPLAQDDDAFLEKYAAEQIVQPLMEANAVSVGCGIGNNPASREVVKKVLKTGSCPVILDADGINSISDNINVIKDNNHEIVMTPHPREFSRITNLDVAEIQGARLSLAKQFAAEFGVILLLKGLNTVIASPDGRAYINPTGNSALAKAGTGDVLTGIIAGLIASGASCFEAAALGAYLHGRCADELVKTASAAAILASDIVDYLPFVMK